MDDTFAERARKAGGGFIIAGTNYGQGSSREHAALAPLHLGVKFVLAKSFARIHRSNLINSGILPLVFVHPEDYGRFALDQELVIENPREQLGAPVVLVKDRVSGQVYETKGNFTEPERHILLAGGKINQIKGE